MGPLETFKGWLARNQVPMQTRSAADAMTRYPTMQQQLDRLHRSPRPWRQASVADALSSPAILRAVTLISHTTGSLTVEAYRNGAVMSETPKLLARPDPYQRPYDFYKDSAQNMATRGEVVWWIATRDTDNLATALVVVPLQELTVEDNPKNRLRPIVKWGDRESTWFSPANPAGQFVHVPYFKEPGALRGVGPLQLCGAAVSVTVEAQEWAANFYAGGGYPSIHMHSPVDMTEQEMDDLINQWMSKPANMPKGTSGELEIKELSGPGDGAQMLSAREYQNGDAARMYGIPGKLVEYATGGSSLTYQNLGELFSEFVRGCLSISYLEPMEQALGDLLPRGQAARFNVKGFLRADIKTRWDVYDIAVRVLGQEAAALWASTAEGFTPGDVEYKPIPYAPPAAIPASLPETRSESEVRCTGKRLRNKQLVPCGKLLSKSGSFVGRCDRCHKEYGLVA
jgi:HK97 family phage portal protein